MLSIGRSGSTIGRSGSTIGRSGSTAVGLGNEAVVVNGSIEMLVVVVVVVVVVVDGAVVVVVVVIVVVPDAVLVASISSTLTPSISNLFQSFKSEINITKHAFKYYLILCNFTFTLCRYVEANAQQNF